LGGAFTRSDFYLGDFKRDPGDATLRYPGYLGPDYEAARVLFIGAVHNGNKLFTDDFRTVEKATLLWRSVGRSRRSDAAYLKAIRGGYEVAMPKWGPWANGFGSVLCKLRLGVSAIVYSNVAKCWSKPRRESQLGEGKQDEQLMEFCSLESRYNVAQLVKELDPLQIYVSARNVYDAVEKWSSWPLESERVWVFNGNTGELLQANKEPRSLHDAVTQYRACIGTGGVASLLPQTCSARDEHVADAQ